MLVLLQSSRQFLGAIFLCVTYSSLGFAEEPKLVETPQEVKITEEQAVSPYIKDFQSKVDQVWASVSKLVSKKENQISTPEVYFSSFEEESQAESWSQWQKQWIEDNPELKFPRTENQKESAISLHYSGTAKIQMNPRGESSFLERSRDYSRNLDDEWGSIYKEKEKEVWVAQPHGFGFYLLGNEMLFYALEKLGVEADLQPCLMNYQPSKEVESLKKQWASQVVRLGLTVERVEMLAYMEKVMIADSCKPLEEKVKKEYKRLFNAN